MFGSVFLHCIPRHANKDIIPFFVAFALFVFPYKYLVLEMVFGLSITLRDIFPFDSNPHRRPVIHLRWLDLSSLASIFYSFYHPIEVKLYEFFPYSAIPIYKMKRE